MFKFVNTNKLFALAAFRACSMQTVLHNFFKRPREGFHMTSRCQINVKARVKKKEIWFLAFPYDKQRPMGRWMGNKVHDLAS